MCLLIILAAIYPMSSYAATVLYTYQCTDRNWAEGVVKLARNEYGNTLGDWVNYFVFESTYRPKAFGGSKFPYSNGNGLIYNFDLDKVTFASQSAIIQVVCKHADLQTVAAKTETCTENGNISYWYCPTCDKCFKDAEAATEIKKAETIIAAHHTMKQVPAKDATCESEGNIAYYNALRCAVRLSYSVCKFSL